MKGLLLFCFIVTFKTAYAQDRSETSYHLFKSKTYVKNPLDLRDPFRRKINKKKSQLKKENYDGYYTNIINSIESKPVESIRIVGVMIGAERRAMAKVQGDSENNTYYLKEGMKVGPNGAEVKAILPGGVVLVEKIRNVYDQDEYLETVIPVSNE
jgi:Tfp pilus assembly protein PilP